MEDNSMLIESPHSSEHNLSLLLSLPLSHVVPLSSSLSLNHVVPLCLPLSPLGLSLHLSLSLSLCVSVHQPAMRVQPSQFKQFGHDCPKPNVALGTDKGREEPRSPKELPAVPELHPVQVLPSGDMSLRTLLMGADVAQARLDHSQMP